MNDALVKRLYDPEVGRFAYVDAIHDRHETPDVVGAYLPLMLPLAREISDVLRAGLRDRFWTPYPLPTTSLHDPAYDPRQSGRGATSIAINWLLAPSFGQELVDHTLQLLERAGFREYYHPETGEGLGARDFTTAAALALDLNADRT